MKKEITCSFINYPETAEGIKALEEKATKALALAIYRSFSPEKLDKVIKELREAVDHEKNPA